MSEPAPTYAVTDRRGEDAREIIPLKPEPEPETKARILDVYTGQPISPDILRMERPLFKCRICGKSETYAKWMNATIEHKYSMCVKVPNEDRIGEYKYVIVENVMVCPKCSTPNAFSAYPDHMQDAVKEAARAENEHAVEEALRKE